MNKETPKIAIVMGSDSDYPVLEDGIKLLKKFGVKAEAFVCSAHRTPERAAEIAKNAEKNGFDVIIGAAGKAAGATVDPRQYCQQILHARIGFDRELARRIRETGAKHRAEQAHRHKRIQPHGGRHPRLS